MNSLSRDEKLEFVQHLIDYIDFNFSMGISQQILIPTGKQKQRGVFRKKSVDASEKKQVLKLSTEFYLDADKQLFRFHRNRLFTVMVKPVLLEELTDRELGLIIPDLKAAGKDFM